MTVEIIGNQVKLTWLVPFNAGSLITDAEIQIAAVDGTSFYSHADCDGAVQETFDARECQITSTELLLDPFYLVQESHILAQARFINAIGWSDWSTASAPILM